MRISDWSSDVCSSDLADRHVDPEKCCRGRGGLRLHQRQFPDRRGLQRHAGVGPTYPWGACDRKLLLLTRDPSKEGLCSEAGAIFPIAPASFFSEAGAALKPTAS